MPALLTSIRLRFELAVGGYPCVADHSPAWSMSGDISVDAVDPAEHVRGQELVMVGEMRD